jgi:hypothetical protein
MKLIIFSALAKLTVYWPNAIYCPKALILMKMANALANIAFGE